MVQFWLLNIASLDERKQMIKWNDSKALVIGNVCCCGNRHLNAIWLVVCGLYFSCQCLIISSITQWLVVNTTFCIKIFVASVCLRAEKTLCLKWVPETQVSCVVVALEVCDKPAWAAPALPPRIGATSLLKLEQLAQWGFSKRDMMVNDECKKH